MTNKYFSNADKVLEKVKLIDNKEVDLFMDKFEKFIHSQIEKANKNPNSIDILYLESETDKYINNFNINFKS
jgi:uncharacterized protein YkvS